MSDPQVLFLDGPLAGEWRSLSDSVNAYQHIEYEPLEFDPPASYGPNTVYTSHVYRITWVLVFDQRLRVAHAGDEDSRTAGLKAYLIPPNVRAKLRPMPALSLER